MCGLSYAVLVTMAQWYKLKCKFVFCSGLLLLFLAFFASIQNLREMYFLSVKNGIVGHIVSIVKRLREINYCSACFLLFIKPSN